MSENTTIQNEPTAPVLIALDSEAFNTQLNAIVGTQKIGWTGDDHINFLKSLLTELKDEEGNPATLDDAQMDRLRLIYRPAEEIQRKVLRQTFADAGYKLDPRAEQIFFLLLSTAQFTDFLANTDNPQTGKPFIINEKKRGAKKNMFASLVGATKSEQKEESQQPEEDSSTETQNPAVAPRTGTSTSNTR